MIRAIHFPTREKLERLMTPGSFCLEPRDTPGQFEMIYVCPCGCSLVNRLLVGDRGKPAGTRPSWAWNGSQTEPTLTPSVHHVDHWHGWLRDGYWEAC